MPLMGLLISQEPVQRHTFVTKGTPYNFLRMRKEIIEEDGSATCVVKAEGPKTQDIAVEHAAKVLTKIPGTYMCIDVFRHTYTTLMRSCGMVGIPRGYYSRGIGCSWGLGCSVRTFQRHGVYLRLATPRPGVASVYVAPALEIFL